MKLLRSLQYRGSNEYLVTSCDYIRGILHTHEQLNSHESDLRIESDIIPVDSTPNKVQFLKNEFVLFADESMELVYLSEKEFNVKMQTWLYERIYKNEELREIAARRFIDILNKVLKIKTFNIIKFLSYSPPEKFGIADCDYFLLVGEGNDFVLYFRMDD